MNPTRVRAIIDYQGKFLLVRNRSSADFWCLPGGKVDAGEDIITALRRELIEETGVEPVIGPLLYVHQFGGSSHYGAPEFFFYVTNGRDFAHIDLAHTTHGQLELADYGFKKAADVAMRPAFLQAELPELAARSFQGPARVHIEN